MVKDINRLKMKELEMPFKFRFKTAHIFSSVTINETKIERQGEKIRVFIYRSRPIFIDGLADAYDSIAYVKLMIITGLLRRHDKARQKQKTLNAILEVRKEKWHKIGLSSEEMEAESKKIKQDFEHMYHKKGELLFRQFNKWVMLTAKIEGWQKE